MYMQNFKIKLNSIQEIRKKTITIVWALFQKCLYFFNLTNVIKFGLEIFQRRTTYSPLHLVILFWDFLETSKLCEKWIFFRESHFHIIFMV